MSLFEQVGGDCRLRVKAVPGARTDQIVGRLGDRLKIRVKAPPEDGKANKAIIQLIAKATGRKASDISIESGHTNAEKTVRVQGVHARELARLFDLDLPDATT